MPIVSELHGVWNIASESILHAVIETVDNVPRYRVLAHLHQVDRSLILKAPWGLPPRLPHLLHIVTLPVLEALSESLR